MIKNFIIDSLSTIGLRKKEEEGFENMSWWFSRFPMSVFRRAVIDVMLGRAGLSRLIFPSKQHLRVNFRGKWSIITFDDWQHLVVGQIGPDKHIKAPQFDQSQNQTEILRMTVKYRFSVQNSWIKNINRTCQKVVLEWPIA